jgi:hypothetical protein
MGIVMKRILVYLLLGFLVLTLGACDPFDDRSETNPDYVQDTIDEYGLEEVYSISDTSYLLLEYLNDSYNLDLKRVANTSFMYVYGVLDNEDILLIIPNYEEVDTYVIDSVFPDYDDLNLLIEELNESLEEDIIINEDSFTLKIRRDAEGEIGSNSTTACEVDMDFDSLYKSDSDTGIYMYLGQQKYDCYENSVYINLIDGGYRIISGNNQGINILFTEVEE